MDYAQILQSAAVTATPIILAFAGTAAGFAWKAFQASERYQKMNWVERKVADIVADSVAATYSAKVRPWKLDSATGTLTPAQKSEAERATVALVKQSAAAAGVEEHLPNDAILRGKVINAVNEAKAKAPAKLTALHSGPSTKGG